ncbi:MAG: sigma-70 family RNA polymerase sigma factor [Parafilimonas sp.]
MQDIFYILKGCMNNDARCQKQLYDRYLQFVLKISFRYVHSFENAANAANDAFVKIFRAIHNFEIRNEDNLEVMLCGWIKRIVVNASIDYMSKENLVPQTSELPEHVWNKSGREVSGESNLVYKELIVLVRKLSPGYRVVFNLYVIDGYTHPEIAQMLGISVGTSKSNLAKAKAFLQKHFIKDNNGNTLCFT